jgi:hypothetical protein
MAIFLFAVMLLVNSLLGIFGLWWQYVDNENSTPDCVPDNYKIDYPK